MADIPGTIEYLTVTAAMGMAVADSADVGELPDLIPSNAKVVFKPVGLNGPLVGAGKIIPVAPIICRIVDGVLYGPADGQAPATSETPALPVRIISPLSTALSDIGWHWQADFTPINSIVDRWTSFAIPFREPTEDDGVTCDLAKALLDPFAAGTPTTPIWLPFLGVGGNGATTIPSNIPAAPSGTLALDYGQTPWFIYYQNGA